MVADIVVFCYTKKCAEAGQGHFHVVPERKGDLKMIHDENDVLTDDELVVARNFLKKSKHACPFIAHGHKLAARMKKRKEEILDNKELSTVQSSEQSSVQSSVHSTEQSSVQSTLQSNDTYIYGVGILVVLAIGVCIFCI